MRKGWCVWPGLCAGCCFDWNVSCVWPGLCWLLFWLKCLVCVWPGLCWLLFWLKCLVCVWPGLCWLFGMCVTRTVLAVVQTNGMSNGLIPMLRVYNNTARYVDQGGNKVSSVSLTWPSKYIIYHLTLSSLAQTNCINWTQADTWLDFKKKVFQWIFSVIFCRHMNTPWFYMVHFAWYVCMLCRAGSLCSGFQ